MLYYNFPTIKDIKVTESGKSVQIDLYDGNNTDTLVMDREDAELLKYALVNQLK
jgi:hypothetical protein